MQRCICLHGHFYQPPRENPWLDVIERQDSAYPYHDWNERITAECYRPNTAARLINSEGKIIDIVNNYEYISFNFGPTLMNWLKRYEPDVYGAIIEADTKSIKTHHGHGNAIAQVYNHIIMPLATRRDKELQVKWGIDDFRSHFHRDPEGMWLAETAVDMETLEVLADYGIRFTILSPYQARRFRKLNGQWKSVDNAIDGRVPYLCRLPGGKSIVLFFYDGPIAQDVAFAGLLNSGEAFYNRLLSVAMADFPFGEAGGLILNVATDGETYGHHHKFAEMALAYTVRKISANKDVVLANYAEFLDLYGVDFEVGIKENTSWSCAHGVERWRSDCGCHIGGGPDWNQKWRAPLREAMDFLRQNTVEKFGQVANELGAEDGFSLEKSYSEVMLGEKRQRWAEKQFNRQMSDEELVRLFNGLEACKFSLFAFTSCGWFFDDISGIEGVQIMAYAARAIEFLQELGLDIEGQYLSILGKAKSNIPGFKDGAYVFTTLVKPQAAYVEDLAAHNVIYRHFIDELPTEYESYGSKVYVQEVFRDGLSDFSITAGRIRLVSLSTLEQKEFEFCSLHTGAYDVRCSLKPSEDGQCFDAFLEAAESAFKDHNLTELVRVMDNYFGHAYFSLEDVFLNERRKIIDFLVKDTVSQFDETFESLYEAYHMFFIGLRKLHYILPPGLSLVLQQVLNHKLRSLIAGPAITEEVYALILNILDDIELYGVSVEVGQIKGIIDARLRERAFELKNLLTYDSLSQTLRLLDVVSRIKIQVDIWHLQNIYFTISRNEYGRILPDIQPLWREIGEKIGVKI